MPSTSGVPRAHQNASALLRLLPPESWDSQQLRSAVESEHIGLVLRAWRTHPHHSRHLSQEALGELLYLSQCQLSRIETGPPIEDIGKLRRWADALQMPQHLRWFSSYTDDPAQRISNSDSLDSLVLPCRTADGKTVLVSASRRTFLQAIGASGMIPLSGDSFGQPAWGIEPTNIDEAAPIEQFAAIRRLFADADNLFGHHQVINPVLRQLQVIDSYRRGRTHDQQSTLFFVQTQYADLLGWLHQDRLDFKRAQYWMDRALEWAHASGDMATIAFVLARKSQLAADRGDSDQALSNGNAAYHLASTSWPRVQAVAAVYCAYAHAMSADARNAAKMFDRSRDMLNRIDEDKSPWGLFFGEAYLATQEAHSFAVLGQHRKALEFYKDAIESVPASYPRDRGVYLARAANVCVALGEDEQAARLAAPAFKIGLTTQSARIIDLVHGIHNRLKERKFDSPYLSELSLTMSSLPKTLETHREV